MPRSKPEFRDLSGSRVAVVNWRDLGHSLAGGSERYAWEFACALRDAGAHVEFVTAQDVGQARREDVDGIRVLRAGGTFTFYFFAAWYLLTRRRQLDVVIDPECGIPTFSPLFLRRSTVIVLIVHHVHLTQFTTYFSRPLATVGRFLEGRLMPRVYRQVRCVAVSESTRQAMRDELHWTGQIGVLPNGSWSPEDSECRPEQKSADHVVVLGRLVPHKRVDLVVGAMPALLEARPNLHLDVVGRGPDEDRLRAQVAELGLEASVTIHGFLAEDDKSSILRRAGLHVCASDGEGWGQVVIEAAAFGVPTIARDVPGLRDSVRHDETGWLIPDLPADLDSVGRQLTGRIDDALTELSDPEARRRVFGACREWASQFSWERMRQDSVALVEDEIHRLS